MNRREYISGAGISITTLLAGCFGNSDDGGSDDKGSDDEGSDDGGSDDGENDDGDSDTGNGGNSGDDEHDCDPIGEIIVYPAIEIPDDEPKLDAEDDGLLEVNHIERVLEQAASEDGDEFRDGIDQEEQTNFENRLADTTGTHVADEAVEEHLGWDPTYVSYQDRNYVLTYGTAEC